MFGKPSKRAKAIAKPRDQAEADKVNIGVYGKYPQMFGPNWGRTETDDGGLTAAAMGLRGANAAQYKSLKKSDQDEIKRILKKGK